MWLIVPVLAGLAVIWFGVPYWERFTRKFYERRGLGSLALRLPGRIWVLLMRGVLVFLAIFAITALVIRR